MAINSMRFLQAVYAQHTEAALIVGLLIEHTDLSEPICVCNNSESIRFDPYVFIAYPFTVSLPNDTVDTPRSATITIDNVDSSIGQTIQELSSPPAITFYIFTVIDNVAYAEVTYPGFLFTSISGDSNTIQGTISVESFFNEPFPSGSFTPTRFPGI